MKPYGIARADRPGLVLVTAAHGLILFALLSLKPAAHTVAPARPLTVALITPSAPASQTEMPERLPPTPRTDAQPPRLPPPVLATTVPTPVPAPAPVPEAVAATPEAASLPAMLSAPPQRTGMAAATPSSAPTPDAQPVVPPVFDADYLHNPSPAYPALSRRLHEQGTVLLRVYVNADGSADRIEVRASSGHERLDRAARDVVGHWRFTPALRGDTPVAAWVLVPISFSLRS